MAVYVDEAIWRWAGRRWCHLLADDVEELHRFASVIGIHRLLYQGPPKTSAPHYDITGLERDRASGWAPSPAAGKRSWPCSGRVRVKNGKMHRKAAYRRRY